MNLGQLQQWYAAHQEQIKTDFFTFLRFQSISTNPEHAQVVRQTAGWLCEYLKEMGMDVELWETPGHPIVYATHLKAGPTKPTVLIYHHYDVQPVDPIDLWESDPFEPKEKNHQIYARGASDNKGQCFYSLSALKAFLQQTVQSELNIKVFIEGEEECGSKGTFACLPQKKKELEADYLLVVDFDLPEANVPGLTLGMRGLLALEVECSNSSIDLHSGMHGGIVLNPNRVLATLLSKLWHPSGEIAVPGFYDDVEPVPACDLKMIDQTFDMEEYKKKFGIRALGIEAGYSPVEANWLRPCLDINGMWGGYQGNGVKTVIPAKSYAKISCRLVAGQQPDRVAKTVGAFLQKQAPEGIVLRITYHQTAPAYRISADSPLTKMISEAFEEVFGGTCRFKLCGASVPIVSELGPISGAQIAMIGCALPEDDIHAPNEHFGWDRFKQGFLTMGRILTLLSQRGEKRE